MPMPMFGNVKSPMPMGPIEREDEGAGYASRDEALEENAKIAESYCGSNPNAMICQSCAGTGVKKAKPKAQQRG
jgi:hypothetical protein